MTTLKTGRSPLWTWMSIFSTGRAEDFVQERAFRNRRALAVVVNVDDEIVDHGDVVVSQDGSTAGRNAHVGARGVLQLPAADVAIVIDVDAAMRPGEEVFGKLVGVEPLVLVRIGPDE